MPNQAKKPRRSPDQVIADLKSKQAAVAEAAKVKARQLQAQIKAQEAKLATARRKEDTHCKVVAGALAIANCAHDHEFKAKLIKLIQESSEAPETKEKILSRL